MTNNISVRCLLIWQLQSTKGLTLQAQSAGVLTLASLVVPAGIVSRYTKEPDVIGMHGGLPPSNTFPFTWFHSGLLPLPSDTTGCAAGVTGAASAHATVMKVEDPQLVSAAQQYNMHAQVRLPHGSSSSCCFNRSTVACNAGWGFAIGLSFQAVQGSTRPGNHTTRGVPTAAESAIPCEQSIVPTISACFTQ